MKKYKYPKRSKYNQSNNIFKKRKKKGKKKISEGFFITIIIGKIIKAILVSILSIILIRFYSLKSNPKEIKKLKVALCTMGRKENLYIKEFVNYYLALGVDKLFLYDDNIEEKEKFINAITPNDSIIIEYCSNYSITTQGQAFTHCYSNHKDEYDWIIMVDVDEYLIINNGTLKQYLSDEIFNKCDFIKIHWKLTTDNNLLHYENKSLFERFKEPYMRSKYIKTILKGGINKLKYAIHSPIFSPERNVTCDNAGRIVNYTKLGFQSLRPFNGDKAYILHFYYKSTEEHINKFKRGYRNWPQTGLNPWINGYFRDNKLTIEKIEMLEREFNITLDKLRNKLFKKKSIN